MSGSDTHASLVDAMEGVLSLLNPGPYGVADDDPKSRLISDMGDLVLGLGTRPVVIGGIAVIVNGLKRQTADVDLLVARRDAMALVRALEASGRFRRKRLERWVHVATGTELDLCVEGELTHPKQSERFPSPSALATILREPLPVAGLFDLLALKAKSGRAQDEGDFVRLVRIHHLDPSLREEVLKRISDVAVVALVHRWWERAREEAAREKDLRPTWGESEAAPP